MPLQLDAVQLPPDAIEVGRVAEAWGVKGWFRVHTYSNSPEAIYSSKRWYLLPSGKGGNAFTGTVMLPVKEAREHAGGVVATAQGVDDRGAAQSLRGARIFIPRSGFPSTAVDEYYWIDLIGLNVVNREGNGLGKVVDLLATAAQAVLVLQYQLDGKVLHRMIPFVAAYVDSVDLPGRLIHVDWQEDY